MERRIYIEGSAVWRPPAGEESESPKLPYVEPLLRRRLSQVTRMAVEVVHSVAALAEGAPLVFASMRGEVSRQLRINRGLVEDADVSPAQFSLSTFNAPPAVATIALGITAGYTAVYPTRFGDALLAASAPVLSGRSPRVVFAFADERVPDEYAGCARGAGCPLAFAAVLSADPSNGVPLRAGEFGSAEEFALWLEEIRR